ncbi:MAG: DUF177 domain-containing protein [Rikenellaceae bacterium]
MKSKESYKINYRALSEGKHNISFHLDPQMFTSEEGGEIHDGNCDVNIRLTKGLSTLRLEITIEGNVTVSCDRCLEDVSVPIRFEGVLIVKITTEVQDREFVIDDKSEDTLLLNPMIEKLDLREYLYDSVILSLPLQRVHSENAEGVSLCNPDMLSRFSIADNDWDADEEDDNEEEDDNL